MWKAVSTTIVAISFSVIALLPRVRICKSRFAQRPAKTQSVREGSRIKIISMNLAAGHHQTDLFLADRFRIDFADDAALVDHDYSIAQAQHLVQLRRYQ